VDVVTRVVLVMQGESLYSEGSFFFDFFFFSSFQTEVSCPCLSSWSVMWVSLESPWPDLVEGGVGGLRGWLFGKGFFDPAKLLLLFE